MDLSIGDIIKRLLRESWDRKVLVVILYVVTSAIFLAVASVWPKVYTSSSTVFVDQQNILRPLMEGTAVTTSSVDRSKIAREVVFSRKSMERLLASSEWFDSDKPTALEKDQMAESIKKRTSFSNLSSNLIRISFKDTIPKRAYETTKLMTSIFIDESLKAKQNESRSAYDFIDGQASEYHKKLKDAEIAIKDFRAKNVDASSAAELAADTRVLQLKRELETVSLQIYEEETALDARQKQLSGESGTMNAASIARESQLSARVEALEARLAELRLTYRDNYPDITQLKGQIETLVGQIRQESEARKSGALPGTTELSNGPIAQDLRRQILRSQTTISSLKSRKDQLTRLLNSERETVNNINAVKAEIAELNRDYSVNQQMYQRLLGQRENAYISMNIDIENQGMTIKIQETASFPVQPKGIRFAHFILAGLVMAFVVPIGVAFGLSLIDQKVRDEKVISERTRPTNFS